MKHVFGFDIDGVLTDDDNGTENTWVVECGRYFEKEPVVASFRLDQALDLDTERIEQFFRAKGEHLLRDMPPRPGSIETLRELKAQGHTVHLITARRQGFRDLTEDWLERHRVPYDTLTMNDFTDRPLGKGKICRHLDVELFVDDNYDNCVDVHRHGVSVLMYYASHNRRLDPPVPVVHDWQDIRTYIRSIVQD